MERHFFYEYLIKSIQKQPLGFSLPPTAQCKWFSFVTKLLGLPPYEEIICVFSFEEGNINFITTFLKQQRWSCNKENEKQMYYLKSSYTLTLNGLHNIMILVNYSIPMMYVRNCPPLCNVFTTIHSSSFRTFYSDNVHPRK